MKSEKGITLISLIIYIIGLLVAITIITVVSSFFYKNIDTSTVDVDNLLEYTKFNSYIVKDINNEELQYINCQTVRENLTGKITHSYAIFNNGNQYTYIAKNKSIYMGKVKIAENVQECEFSVSKDINTQKKKLNVRIKFIDDLVVKENSYVIN